MNEQQEEFLIRSTTLARRLLKILNKTESDIFERRGALELALVSYVMANGWTKDEFLLSLHNCWAMIEINKHKFIKEENDEN